MSSHPLRRLWMCKCGGTHFCFFFVTFTLCLDAKCLVLKYGMFRFYIAQCLDMANLKNRRNVYVFAYLPAKSHTQAHLLLVPPCQMQYIRRKSRKSDISRELVVWQIDVSKYNTSTPAYTYALQGKCENFFDRYDFFSIWLPRCCSPI